MAIEWKEPMIDRSELTPALKRIVVDLVDDLRERADTVIEVGDVVRAEYTAAQAANRTAHDLETWREGLLTQVAVSWVLGCVFVRFCEDNGLVPQPLLSGRGEWRRWAADAQTEYFRANREAGERAYLLHVFGHAAELPGLSEVFGSHNPLWQFGPSDDTSRRLIQVWREVDPESGELIWDFADDAWDTRFLGDLYQDLSEHAKKMYALLQTPEFVEEFILDRTLDPAIEEFGLGGDDGSGFRMIDPACGSGHFLLGGFARLATRWLERDPAAGRRAAAARALQSVFGVDINPFAVAIARFRLLAAALRFADVGTLAEAPAFEINVAVGDSLLHGPAPGRLIGQSEIEEWRTDAAAHLYATEDAESVGQILGKSYHAVVANPPYITPRDPAANQAYRDRYATCHRQYSLAVPFMERLFGLALRGASGRRAGFVGQITANSFMKREFGSKVIEEFLNTQVELTHVIDASGAYIPGHGTPTVILVGRNRAPSGGPVRAVLGGRGEPAIPDIPEDGYVWSSIVDLVDQVGAENEYVTVADLDRGLLARHPWSLQGGAAIQLKAAIEARASRILGACCADIGAVLLTRADDAFIVPSTRAMERRVGIDELADYIEGDRVRNWTLVPDTAILAPFDEALQPRATSGTVRLLWPARQILRSRVAFGKSQLERGVQWFEYSMLFPRRAQAVRAIHWSDIHTHNHFVLREGFALSGSHAPCMVLDDDNSDQTSHMEILARLNSAVGAFWIKQVCFDKGLAGAGNMGKVEQWRKDYEFDAAKIKDFPLADGEASKYARAATELGRELTQLLNDMKRLPAGSIAARLEEHSRDYHRIQGKIVWLQEELDWRIAFLYGLTPADLSTSPDAVFPLSVGERAFEIHLARQIERGAAATSWFQMEGVAPLVEMPRSWPDWYRDRVEQRIRVAQSDRFVNLLERPEYKRRWNWEPWESIESAALRSLLVSRLEDDTYWRLAETRSAAQLADLARADGEFVEVAERYLRSSEIDFVKLIGELMASDAVPYLSVWRLRDPGLRKRRTWEKVWDLQRQDDAGVAVGKIPMPPTYAQADFRSATMWRLRGKLDVPKERFISYPGTERDADTTAVYGWAGWDHLERAKALVALYQQRRDQEGWVTERLNPILAGLAELIPWLRQWHNDVDPDLGIGLGDYFADYLAGETHRNGLSPDDLAGWRPPEKTKRTRKSKAAT